MIHGLMELTATSVTSGKFAISQDLLRNFPNSTLISQGRLSPIPRFVPKPSVLKKLYLASIQVHIWAQYLYINARNA